MGVANQGVGGLIKNGFKTMEKYFSGKNLNKDWNLGKILWKSSKICYNAP